MTVSFQESELFRVLTGPLHEDIYDRVNELCEDNNIRERGVYKETYLHCLMTPRAPRQTPDDQDRLTPMGKKKKKKSKKKGDSPSGTDSPVSLNGQTTTEAPQDDFSVALINGLIYQLVNKGISVNAIDVEGNTPLHIAALNDVHPGIIATFIRVGADPTMLNQDGCTPRDLAEVKGIITVLEYVGKGLCHEVECKNIEKVSTLLEFWCSTNVELNGLPLMLRAEEGDNEEIIIQLMSRETTNAIVFSTLAGDVKATKACAKRKDVDVNTSAIENIYDEKKYNNSLLLTAIRMFRFNTAKVLVDNGADVNAPVDLPDESDDPLFVYVLKRDDYVSNSLLKAIIDKADLSLSTLDPFELFYNSWRRQYSQDVEALLMSRGYCSLELRDKQCYTLRDRVLKEWYFLPRDQLKELLWRIDRHVVALATQGLVEPLMTLAQAGYDYIRVTNKKGKSIVTLAQKENQRECVEFLELLPDYQRKGYSVHYASKKGNMSEFKESIDDTLAAFRDREGRTPLHVAVLYERTFIVKWYLGHQPEVINMADTAGRAPLHYAFALESCKDIRDMLITAGAQETMVDQDGKVPTDYSGDAGQELIESMRRAPGSPDTYLLDRYLNLADAIDTNDLEMFNITRESLVGVTLRDIDEILPKNFPKLSYRPLTFQCLPRGQEDMAILLLTQGANPEAVSEIELPGGGSQRLGLLAAAEKWNCQKVVEFLKADNNSASYQRAVSAVTGATTSNGTRSATPDSLKTDCTLPDFGDMDWDQGGGAAPKPSNHHSSPNQPSSACYVL